MKLSSIIAGFFTLASVAQASVIKPSQQQPNTAQQIPVAAFSLGYNPIIANSATLPWVTIDGTGDDTHDYYSFEVPNSGMIASIFDVDNAGGFDSFLTLYDSSGNYLAHHDDQGDGPADPGSNHHRDSYLIYTFNAPGVYVIAVGRWSGIYGPPGDVVPNFATHKLHISLGYSQAQLRAAYGMGDPHFKVRLSKPRSAQSIEPFVD
ncbi:Hemolysin-type calcium-binding repeat (2 copies) [Seminavis robusta]|uniref:Hemolysin-type calcium-binding repeat (2 copies) n=1 Tax=Seminavis robusta TaxID=568900 RepID=A0A9N8HV68_9STRA|nr:Hemolysin-type calcium-binding repeat (2 copies) [Seminavis robusta]|eukprot:Sro1938_g306540.1 Hemolysin-type calcium-binding repeat (2 copies) (206) ;mRNA; f:18552-19245